MLSVLEAIHTTSAATPDRIALSDAAGTVGYAHLRDGIARHAAGFSVLGGTVALLMPRDRRHIVADLALASLGRTIVPLPDFFSPAQWGHILADAGVDAIVTIPEWRDRVAGFGRPVAIATPASHAAMPAFIPSRRLVYTSGTTGQPKGVLLPETALEASLGGLAKAVEAGPRDVHMSLLPFSLLLEQLAGVLLPLRFGARLHIAGSPLEAATIGATTAIVVPRLLASWVEALAATAQRAPASLRFVAVGGAAVGDALASRACAVGLPVHEGYGLTECCSVVAVNRPGRRRAGTVGDPLDGVCVTIEAGEIVVRGPTVMTGYLGGRSTGGLWHTGDLGRIDPEGRLIVLGRKDDVIVTQEGRNLHPDWIEPMLMADPAIRRCAVVAGPGGVTAVLVPDESAAVLDIAEWRARVAVLTGSAPAYARPSDVRIMTAEAAAREQCFTADGRPRRRHIAMRLDEDRMRFHDTLLAATAAERLAFTSLPIVAGAVAGGVCRGLYLAFLHSAYHHVRYTVPLLSRAIGACGPDDGPLALALADYVAEETGHEQWILDDIAALGGTAEATVTARAPLPVGFMVAHAFQLIAEEGPYALLGMIHVLEGMSVALASQAARSIRQRIGVAGSGGFRYLTSHGSLDLAHVDGFARLLDAIDTAPRRATVIAAARDFYGLYGAVFTALDAARSEADHAA